MKATVAWGALLVGLISLQAAPFQNLGFDEADTNHVYDPDPFPPLDLFGTVSEMLPGWQLFLGTNAETRVGLNTTLPGVGYASLMDSNNAVLFPPNQLPVEGMYSVALVPDAFITPDRERVLIPYLLVQLGEVPADAQSLRFANFGAPCELIVNGESLPLLYLYGPPTGNATTRRADVFADISPFAGQTVELRFVTLSSLETSVNGLDSISFSPLPVPEPGLPLLLVVGVGMLVWFRAGPRD